jgi:hypothetical protein
VLAGQELWAYRGLGWQNHTVHDFENPSRPLQVGLQTVLYRHMAVYDVNLIVTHTVKVKPGVAYGTVWVVLQ